jgi:thiamine transporter
MFKTKDLVTISLLAALCLVLSQVKLLEMPNGGSISLYLVPIFIIAYFKDLRLTFTAGFVSSILQVIFGGHVLNFLQVFLDYTFPLTIICMARIWPVKNFYLQLIISCVLAFVSYVLSGMIFFGIPLIPSMIYNATYFVPTVVINLIIVYFLLPRIKNYM